VLLQYPIKQRFQLRVVLVTYIVNAVDEGIVAAVAHGQPITTEPDDVDVAVPASSHNQASITSQSVRVYKKLPETPEVGLQRACNINTGTKQLGTAALLEYS
jgi:hypothetical protein